MACVVTEPCIGCKYAQCVSVCPTDCFFEGEDMLYINPDECIDCDQCIEACPITAIMKDTDAPQEWCDKNRNFPFSEDKRINDPSQVTHGPNYDPNHPNLVG